MKAGSEPWLGDILSVGVVVVGLGRILGRLHSVFDCCGCEAEAF